MIYHGIALMISAGAGLFGVLYQLHHMTISAFHDRLWQDPLAAPQNRPSHRHLRRQCDTCSMIAELATTRLVTRG